MNTVDIKEIERLRNEFYNTPLPIFSSSEWFDEMFEKYTEELRVEREKNRTTLIRKPRFFKKD